MIRFLVVDAYDARGRAALRAAGGTDATRLYERLLERVSPGASVEILRPADAAAELPTGAALRDYDGAVWTGSNLSLGIEEPAVRRHIELARATYAAGVPSFGSCYAAQLAVVAAGGECRANPRGREFGVSRDIRLTEAGRAHPMFAGKPPVYDSWTSHADEIVALPAGATILAANAWSRVQAVAVQSGKGEFWAVQYHPEYDPHEIACHAALRADELVAQGTFADGAAVDAWRDAIEAAPRDPAAAAEAGLQAALLEPGVAECELSNWVKHLVLARQRR